MNTVITSYAHLSNNLIADKSDYVHKQMLLNAVTFPNPDPTMAEFLTIVTDFEAAYEAAKSRSSFAIDIRNEKRILLNSAMTKIALYVNDVADGKRNVANLSGLTLTKERQPVGTMLPPDTFRQKPNALEGTVDLRFNKVRGATTFVGQISTDNGDTWTQAFISGKASATISGLVSGAKVKVRVASIGAAGMSNWSNPYVAKVA